MDNSTCIKPRILIGALSGANHTARRMACYGTWMKRLHLHPTVVDAAFLMAAPDVMCDPPKRLGARLYLPVPDAYDTLPQRTRHFCLWALDHSGWDYLFKCDDDTYICIDRLATYEFPPGADYIGAEWKRGVLYGSGGAGYFLSRRAAEIVAEQLTHESGPEDLLVGRLLRNHGIPLHIEPRLIAFGDMNRPSRRPTSANQIITTHKISPPDFVVLHREIYGRDDQDTSLADSRSAAVVVPSEEVPPGEIPPEAVPVPTPDIAS